MSWPHSTVPPSPTRNFLIATVHTHQSLPTDQLAGVRWSSRTHPEGFYSVDIGITTITSPVLDIATLRLSSWPAAVNAQTLQLQPVSQTLRAASSHQPSCHYTCHLFLIIMLLFCMVPGISPNQPGLGACSRAELTSKQTSQSSLDRVSCLTRRFTHHPWLWLLSSHNWFSAVQCMQSFCEGFKSGANRQVGWSIMFEVELMVDQVPVSVQYSFCTCFDKWITDNKCSCSTLAPFNTDLTHRWRLTVNLTPCIRHVLSPTPMYQQPCTAIHKADSSCKLCTKCWHVLDVYWYPIYLIEWIHDAWTTWC